MKAEKQGVLLVWSLPFRLLFGSLPENAYLCGANSMFRFMNERIEMLIEELDALALEYRRNEVLTLQMKVQKWAIRFNRWPRICRPVCLHYFKKWAKRYNDVVCFLYPPAPGAPLPIEELFSNLKAA